MDAGSSYGRVARLRRINVSAAMPPRNPARMDSTGKPGTGGGGTVVVPVVVLVVTVILVVVLTTVVDVMVPVTVVVAVEVWIDVVVPGTTSGPYLRIKPRSPTIHPSSDVTMNTDLRATAIVGGRGSVPTTSHVRPSQCTIWLRGTVAFCPTAQPSFALAMYTEVRFPSGAGTRVH